MAKGEKVFRNRASAFKGKRRRQRIEEEKQAKDDFNRQMDAYRRSEVLGNIYEDTPDFSENLVNPYEDLTVNQQQAQFERDAARQALGDVAAQGAAVAGGSGFGSFATSLARQAQMGAAQASASIGQQEAANQRLAAQGADALQTRQMAARQQQFMMQKQGEEAAYNRATQRQETLLAMAGERKAAATAARQANTQMWMSLAGTVIGAGASLAGGALAGAGGGGGTGGGTGN
tara:strand:+ start:6669 stop:7364 length:696 start_codon:yes stop_codon:yes gene_type:complete